MKTLTGFDLPTYFRLVAPQPASLAGVKQEKKRGALIARIGSGVTPTLASVVNAATLVFAVLTIHAAARTMIAGTVGFNLLPLWSLL